MDDKFILGELKSSVEHMRADITDIKQEVKALSSFKWKVTGIMVAVVSLFEIVIAFIRIES